MKTIYGLTGLVLVSLLLFTCKKTPKTLTSDEAYPMHWPENFDPPLIPADNALTTARVALGKRLFFDPILSRDSTVSCNTCHKQEFAFADDLPISPGVEDRLGFRNAPSLANVAWLGVVNRDGGVVKLDLQASVPIEDENEMDFTLLEAADRLNKHPRYVQLCQEAYGRPADPFVITRALGAFQRTLISNNSPYDHYVFQQKTDALTESQIKGMQLFFSEKASCSNCHSGFNLTNNKFENNGLHENYDADTGRRRVTLKPEDEGKFRVPSLRNVALTAPYMHDGTRQTLESVIEHYNSGGSNHPLKNPLIRPLALSPEEKTDLIHFLESLTDSTFILNSEYHNN
ncbi:MAG: methylamine utilization protein [Saprospiraceae bacterium]|nr:MAG: methylamine utilization protein [Saprospiraceae bacterium]